MDGDLSTLFQRAVKYLIEGLVVAVVAFVLPAKGLKLQEVLLIALTAAATFALLDQFAPSVGDAARTGAGFGIGAHTVGFAL